MGLDEELLKGLELAEGAKSSPQFGLFANFYDWFGPCRVFKILERLRDLEAYCDARDRMGLSQAEASELVWPSSCRHKNATIVETYYPCEHRFIKERTCRDCGKKF